MSPTSPFQAQQQALTKALAHYDSIAADSADPSALAAAEHHIYLASKALTMQVTPPGVFVLDRVFQVGTTQSDLILLLKQSRLWNFLPLSLQAS